MSRCSSLKFNNKYTVVSYFLSAEPFRATLCGLLGGAVMLLVTLPTAQAASCKLPKSYYKNVACTSSSGYFLASKDFGAPVALIDSKGKPVVDLSQYEKVAANKIAGGLIPVQRSRRVGYVNMQGHAVIPLMYDTLSESSGWARAVSEGRIVVKKGGSYGVISTDNQTVVPFSSSFNTIDNYRNGQALTRKNKVSSYLDKDGNTIDNSNNSSDDGQASNTKPSPSAPIDKLTTDPAPSKSATFTSLEPDQQDGKWGFVDDKKTIMITYSFDEVRPFSEGLAGVRIDNDWGFLNLGGELVIPFNFKNSDKVQAVDTASMFIFKEDKAWVGNLSNGDKICIGKQGNVVDCA